MLSFETRPAIPIDRAAPNARWAWCWPALSTTVAVILDATWPLMPGESGMGVLWLDVAAVACLVWAASGPRAARRGDWGTPVDGRVLSGFVLGVLAVVRMAGAYEPVQWLHQIASAGLCFYALGARLRRDSRAADAMWPAFALFTLVLSLLTLGPLTHGVDAFVARTELIDVRWVSRFGLGKTLLLVTVLCAGRASESGARAFWRVTALVGGVSCLVHLLVNGWGLGVSSLGSLDEPFYFGTSIVAFVLLAGLAREAWQLVGERPEEAARWRAATLVFPIVIVQLLFGGTTGGEGVRTVAALAGAAVIATRFSPRVVSARPAAPRPADASPAARAEPPAGRAA
jgi:hypothetical protein